MVLKIRSQMGDQGHQEELNQLILKKMRRKKKTNKNK